MRGVTLTFSAQKPLLDQVRQVATAEQVSVAEIVRRAIRAELARVRTFKPSVLRDTEPAR